MKTWIFHLREIRSLPHDTPNESKSRTKEEWTPNGNYFIITLLNFWCSHVSHWVCVHISHELRRSSSDRDIFRINKYERKKSWNFNISKIKDDQQQPLRGVDQCVQALLAWMWIHMKSKANATSCFFLLIVSLWLFCQHFFFHSSDYFTSHFFMYDIFFLLSLHLPSWCLCYFYHSKPFDTFFFSGDRLTRNHSQFRDESTQIPTVGMSGPLKTPGIHQSSTLFSNYAIKLKSNCAIKSVWARVSTPHL